VATQRVGEDRSFVTTFSVVDAKRARLWGREGPWTNYPDRMLYYRALGFHVRDYYADLLHGFVITEEARDYPTVVNGSAEVAGPAEPPPPPEITSDPLFVLAEPKEPPGPPAETCGDDGPITQPRNAATEVAQTPPEVAVDETELPF